MTPSMGKRFKQAVAEHKPLQVVGTINAYSAMLAQSAGCKAIYLSGAGVANASYGLPDLGMTSLHEVLEDVRRITDACSLPLLVDIDTGWGQGLQVARTIKLMERAGAAGVHIEDQIATKRCGHRPNKAIVPLKEMGDKIKAAVDGRKDNDFVIMARTDAYSIEGMDAALERAQYCVANGADMIFPEAITTLDEYRQFAETLSVPILANITEFGNTPLFTRDELEAAKVSLILYPLTAFRAMSQAALSVYNHIVQRGSQKALLETMQTRSALYDVLGYQEYESKIDQLLGGVDEQ